MSKEDLVNKIERSKNKIERSKNKIKNTIKEKGLGIEETSNLIKEILEGEFREIQLVTNLYYIDGLSIEEIAQIIKKDEITILIYFQYILFKINFVLDNNNEFLPEQSGKILNKKV